jgi:chorismate mutase
MEQITSLRKNIDKLDKNIIELISERFKITNNIGKLKKDNNIKVFDNNRENELYIKIKKYNNNILSEDDIVIIYKTIISLSKNKQSKLLVQTFSANF